jgi:GNAT superfamily N-acetyltransferase
MPVPTAIATALAAAPDAPSVRQRLADGRTVSLTPLGADDHEALAAFYEALTPASRRLRFLQAMPVIRPRLVRQMTEVDQRRHVAWVARVGDRIVGEARYVRLRDEPAAAEVAFAVAEDVRRIGLARLLVETLGVLARADGVTTFTSTVSEENRGSTALLRELGSSFRFDSGALEGRGPVPDWTRSPDQARELEDVHRAHICASLPAAA